MQSTPQKVLVGLSGGVDSAVTVRLLQEEGYHVEGLVICFSPAHQNAVENAEVAAKELQIALSVCHCEDLFEQEVVHLFCNEYSKGRTPNPCVVCNPLVKFHVLCEEADKRGIHFVASGHYAQISQQKGHYYVAQAASIQRDQSYMLYRLPQNILSRLLLPVGGYEKPIIRQMAKDMNLTSAKAPDSQEICFIPDGNHPAYIQQKGYADKPGNFIGPSGEVLGPHKGVMHYTVGQRRGVGLALGKPIFVKNIASNGDITLGYAGQEFAASIELSDIVTTTGKPFDTTCAYTVKIRSAAKPVPCHIAKIENAQVSLCFDEPQRAPAPGQHAVLYADNLVVGGGVIESSVEKPSV